MHIGTPAGEAGSKCFRLLLVAVSQVPLLARILAQVEKLDAAVLIPLDELPIAVADRAERRPALIPVVRVVPEQRGGALEFPALEQGNEADRVAMLLRIKRQMGQLEQRGIKVRSDDKRVAD